MTQQLLLRREPFGGILAQQYGNKIKFINHTGFEIIYSIAKGLKDDEIVMDILSRYEAPNEDEVRNDIQKIRSMILKVDEWPKNVHLLEKSDRTEKPFSPPTLSAPLDLHWEVTNRCNLYCLHCYNRSSLAKNEPSLKQIHSVLNELKSIKLRNVIISGGEPLMRKDLKTIIEWVRPRTSIITLSTNGTLIDDYNSSWFPGLIDGVNLSLDVGNKSAYENFRGKKGSFAKCIRGLRLLVEKDIPVAIQTTISRWNIDQLDKLANLIIKEGATSWIVRMPIASGRAIENESDFLTHEEIIEKEPVLSKIRERYQSKFKDLNIGVNFLWNYQTPYSSTQRKDRTISCAAATVLAVLLADGRIAPCPLFADTDFKSEVVWNKGFIDQWKNAKCMKTMRSIKLSSMQLCFHCTDFGKVCNTGCRAKSYLSGNLYAPDPDCGYLNPQ